MLFNNAYLGKRVFITGHAGFKGSWLTLWLTKLGATVKGYSLYPWTGPSHWNLLNLSIESINCNIGDAERLEKEIADFCPDIVFHLTAQAIVLKAYENPVETYETNVIGTLKLFEACRKVDSIKAVVNITSDKCYENKDWPYRYREIDPVGGYDPYSSSKACSEILTSSYRNSYWNLQAFPYKHHVLLASCRAGNVIGGGDWARDRLIPNAIRAVQNNTSVFIRDSSATRPWTHVLDALSGYLLVGERLLAGKQTVAKAWNFGSADENSISVVDAIKLMQKYWPEIKMEYDTISHPHETSALKLMQKYWPGIKMEYDTISHPHETSALNIDCSQAHIELHWKPIWKLEKIFEKTTIWYKNYIEYKTALSSTQIDEYMADATEANAIWTR